MEFKQLTTLNKNENLHHFSFDLQIPNIDRSKASEKIVGQYVEKLEELRELEKLLKTFVKTNLIKPASTELISDNKGKASVDDTSKQILSKSSGSSHNWSLFPYPINKGKNELLTMQPFGESKTIHNSNSQKEEDSALLFHNIIIKFDENAVDTLLKNKMENFREPFLGSTILHLCTRKISLLIGSFYSKNADASKIMIEVEYFHKIIFKLINSNSSLTTIKNKAMRTPIQEMAEHCPMIVNDIEEKINNNETFKKCKSLLKKCAEECSADTAESKQALSIIDDKLSGQYAKVLLPSSKKYIFWHKETVGKYEMLSISNKSEPGLKK